MNDAGMPVRLIGQMAFSQMIAAKGDAPVAVKAGRISEEKVEMVRDGKSFAFRRDAEELHVERLSAVAKMKVVSRPDNSNARDPGPGLPFGLAGLVPEGQAPAAGGLSDDDVEEIATAPAAQPPPQPPAGADPEEAEALEAEEEAPEVVEAQLEAEARETAAATFSGSRLGVVAYGLAVSSKSACLVCLEQGLSAQQASIPTGAWRFQVRLARRAVDRYCHKDCILGGAVLRLKKWTQEHNINSADLLNDVAFQPDLPRETQNMLLSACDVFREAGSGAASSSGRAPGGSAG